ncbi:hypothetical protein FSP39_021778 [Pinctada imbricata]|uniref:Uncharacterized protein n=1 Tax=Pinctada imbricata TaxID=66713 RepID=A0AA88YPE0_PINIB|nr:hypothetical protein FSP39_021778 [Pinctada imbricata]
MLDICSSLGNVEIFLIGLATVFYFVLRSSDKKNLPPGPKGLPIIGAINELKSAHVSQDFPRLRKQYGDVFTLRIGPRVNIVINGHKALKDLIIKEGESLSERPHNAVFDLVTKGHGIGGANGELWKEQRTFALKTLRDFGFGKRSLENQIMEEVSAFLDEMGKENGAPFDVRRLISVSVSNIICSILFGERFEYGDKRFVSLLDLLNIIATGGAISGIIPNSMIWLRHLPGDWTGLKKVMAALKQIEEFTKEEIERHVKTFDENKIRDYVDAFIAAQKRQGKSNGSFYTDLQLQKTILNFFGAGSETTATTVRWAILYLIIHQDVQEKMNEEIKRVVGDATPSLSHKMYLPYCEAVITEVQRIGNIAPNGVPHGAKNDVHWNGYVIPKGALVILNLTSVNMDPETFPEPDKFKPERFLDADGKFCGKNKVIPFSLGRRACLGESLARMELFFFIVSIVHRFILRPEKDGDIPKPECILGFTRSPKPFRFRAIERKGWKRAML